MLVPEKKKSQTDVGKERLKRFAELKLYLGYNSKTLQNWLQQFCTQLWTDSSSILIHVKIQVV